MIIALFIVVILEPWLAMLDHADALGEQILSFVVRLLPWRN